MSTTPDARDHIAARSRCESDGCDVPLILVDVSRSGKGKGRGGTWLHESLPATPHPGVPEARFRRAPVLPAKR